MNPIVQATLAQVLSTVPASTPPTEPLAMKATMEISEEWERQEKETTKALEDEANDCHEHLENQHLQIDEVVCEEEEIGSSRGGDEGDASTEIVQTFDEDFEDELVQQLKDVREEVEIPPLEEEGLKDDTVEESTKILASEQEEGPKHDEEMPLSGEQEEQEKEEYKDVSPPCEEERL